MLSLVPWSTANFLLRIGATFQNGLEVDAHVSMSGEPKAELGKDWSGGEKFGIGRATWDGAGLAAGAEIGGEGSAAGAEIGGAG